MNEPQVVGEVIVRVKPVLDEGEMQRVVNQATASASNAQQLAGAASSAASNVSARASALQNRIHNPTITAAGSGVERNFTRGTILNQLYDELRPQIDEMQGLFDRELDQFAAPFTFASKKLPSEITRQLEGHPSRNAIRRLFTTGVAGGNGPDALSHFGEDAYFRMAEYAANAPRGHALEAASRSQDPRHQYLAALAQQLPTRAADVPKMEMVNLAALTTGTKFRFGGVEASIIEPDEGERYVRSPLLKHDLPVGLLGFQPADVGSQRVPTQLPVPDFGSDVGAAPMLPTGLGMRETPTELTVRGRGRGQLALPYYPSPNYGPAIPMGGPGDMQARIVESSPRRFSLPQLDLDAAEFDNFTRARSSYDQFKTYQRLMEDNPKLRNILSDGIAAQRAGFESRGYVETPDGMRPAGGSGGRRPPPPPPVSPTPNGDDAEPSRRPDLTAEDFGHYRFRGNDVVIGPGSGARSSRKRSRYKRWADRILDYGDGGPDEDFAGGAMKGNKRDTLFGLAGRKTLGLLGRPITSRISIGNRFRLARAGRILRKFANMPSMSFGNYMNLMFGGGELLGAASSIGRAAVEGAATSNLIERGQLELQAYQQASGGYFGRFANLAIDPIGVRQGQISSTLRNSERINQFVDARGVWLNSLSGAGTAAPITDVGQQVLGLTQLVSSRVEAGRERATMSREGRRAFVDEAVSAAGPRGFNETGAMLVYSLTGWSDQTATRVRDREMDAANSAGAVQLKLEAQDRLRQVEADKAVIGAAFRDLVGQQRRATEDIRIAARNIGNPIQAQREAMQAQFARERADAANPDFRKQYISEMRKVGYDEDEAQSMFQSWVDSIDVRQVAARDAFETEVEYRKNVVRGAFRRGTRINQARRNAYDRRPGAGREYSAATEDEVYQSSYQGFRSGGMTESEAGDLATRARDEFIANRDFQTRMESDAMKRSSEASARVAGYNLQNKPWEAQREAARSRAQEAMERIRIEHPDLSPDQLADQFGQSVNEQLQTDLSLIDKSEQDTRRMVGINLDTREAVGRAVIDVNRGRRSRFAPRLEGIYGNYRSEAESMKQSGLGDFGGRLQGLYEQDVEATRAQFLSEFRPFQNKSLDSIDTSGDDFRRIAADFNDAKGRSIAGSAGEDISTIINGNETGYRNILQERSDRLYLDLNSTNSLA